MSWEIHVDWKGQPRLVGRLHAADRGPAVSFEYAPEYLRQPDAFAIDPTALPLRPGTHHSPILLGAMQDCGPDRWGRLLIERAVRKKVIRQKPYRDIDFVLVLDDATRLGALRFRADVASPFLAVSTGKLPPIVRLRALLRASDAIQSETDTAEDLRFLLGAGSPLGGARPKSAVALPDGRLALAKFPMPNDTRDIAAGEILALTLAAEAGLRVVEHQLVPVAGHGLAIITRFDRAGPGHHRIPFVSGASLLGLGPEDPGSYTRLADGIRQFGHDVAGDLRELWGRLVFSLLASNYDDHLRNHGFLMVAPGRWALSPAYDLNPTPEIDRVRVPKLPISEDSIEPTIAAALDVAPRFGLDATQARTLLRRVFIAVVEWRRTGRRLRLRAQTLDAYASAFEHALMDEARAFLGK